MPTLYDGDLNKNMDFAHAGPNGEPASGKAVQKYIKDIDKKKISVGGQFQDKYYFFNSQEEMEEYAADPSKYYLIMSEIQLEEQYRLSIQLENDYYPVFLGQTGNYIHYTFSTVDRDSQVIRESVDVQYVITCGNSKQTVNATYPAGAQVAFNVDEYLREGTNDISFTVRGQTTKVTASRNVTFDVVDLQISDNFDITQQYQNGDNLVVSFSLKGNGTKTVEFYIDGEVQPIDSHTDIYNGTPVQGSKNIYLTGLGSGRHNLQYRAFITMGNGTKFYSDVLYRDFVIVDQQLGEDVIILTKFTSPSTNGIVDAFTQPIPLYGAVQYEDFPVNYCIYTAQTLAEYGFTITFGSNVSEYTIQKGRTYEYLVKSMTSTTTPLVFACQESSLTYNAFIEQSTYDLDIIPGAVMDFNGSDRTNSSNNRDTWTDGRNTGTLTGFNWTENSGWNGNRLIVPAGAQFNTNYAPFNSNTLTTTGFTFEIEFSTSRVQNEDTPIIDLTTPVGGVNRGLLITASEIIFSSRGGVTVNTKYKPEENMRVSIVVNPLSSATYERLLFIYVDGILTGAIEYARSDSFMSSKLLSVVGTEDATISIKQIKTYNRPLSADEILNNYILYRDTVAELVDAYDRNDIYVDGTNVVSKDKLAMRTPIIVITCNDDTDDTPDRIAMMNGWDKNNKGTYVKMHKMEIINMADPTYNITIYNPSMRCQGTSSMAYPRKNFRFYLQADSKDATVPPYQTHVYDYQGNEIGDTGDNKKKRLYSFKAGAQPVKTWCLKADYAESSSTHNTGVARLWTDVMKNARIDNASLDSRFYLKDLFPDTDTPCKTIAQHMAEAAGYKYDVRTTVDGFPIALFYHVHESDPLIFLGRYNWNNDKSTESVYGFCDIPGFDDEFGDTMECWEVVNGDFPCNLFTDVSHWEDTDSNGWRHSYEARYPDDHEKQSEIDRGNNGALRRVATWINSTMGASKVDTDPTSATYNKMIVDNAALMERFKTGDPNAEVGEGKNGKWDFLDIYKLAAYYVYLMRFGGVDQTVKNAMFTTEDGKHWFYINYDNDTINGVRNDGALKFGYNIDRQSKDPDSADVYCYAGHESVLWNNLEADDEFMGIVSIIDNALYRAGLSYDKVIDMFNNKQSAKWSERTHNEDYKFKYLDGIDRMQLTKLQGPRKSHRQWWLSHRFTLWDAIDGTDAYIANLIQIKPDGTASPTANDYVTVTPAVSGQIFGFGLERPEITGVYGQKDVPITFPMTKDYYIGTTLKYYNAAYFKEIDLSHISNHINEIDFSKVNTTAFDTSLSSLVMGTMSSDTNTAMQVITGLGNMKYLENLEMVGYTGFNNIDLYENRYLKTLDFRNCTGLTSVTLPPAAPLETIHYPANMQTIEFVDLLNLENFDIQNNGLNVRTITVNNCKNISICKDISFLANWVESKNTPDEECFVDIDNIDWKNVDPNDLIAIGEFGQRAGEGHLILKGTAAITSNSQVIAQRLIELFGPSITIPGSEFYVTGPDALFIVGDSVILEGDSATFTPVIFSPYKDGTITWSYTGSRTGTTAVVNEDKSYTITTTENGNSTVTLTVKVNYLTPQGSSTATKSVQIKKRVYPTSSQISIEGKQIVDESNQYDIVYSITGIDGRMTMLWSLAGDITNYVSIISDPTDTEKCVLTVTSPVDVDVASGTLSVLVKKYIDESTIGTASIGVVVQDDSIAITSTVNPYAMEVMYNNHLAASPDKMTKAEAAEVTWDQLNPDPNSYSTSIFYANSNFRTKCTDFSEFQYFTKLTAVPAYCFYNCIALKTIMFPSGITQIGKYSFYMCNYGSRGLNFALDKSNFSSLNLEIIGDYAFFNSSVYSGRDYYNNSTKELIIPDSVEYIGSNTFYGYPHIERIKLPNNNNFKTINNGAFQYLSYYVSNSSYPTLEIPSSVETIADNAFYCTHIKIDFGGNSHVKTIGTYAFINVRGFQYLGDSFVFPDSIESIGNSAFENTDLNCIKFSSNSNLTTIGNKAFREVSSCSWDKIYLPSSLTSIGESAFAIKQSGGTLDLSNLNNVTSWGWSAFNTPVSYSTNGSGTDYKYGYTKLILPVNMTETPGLNVFGSVNLSEIVWPSAIKTINTNTIVFHNMTNIVFPEGTETIKYNAICYKYITNSQYYDYIKETPYTVTIPATVTTLEGNFAGLYCNIIKYESSSSRFVTRYDGSMIVDENTHTLVAVAKSIQGDITIDDDILHVGDYVFNLISVKNMVPPGSHNPPMIQDFKNITSITISDTLISIGEQAFAGLTGVNNSIVFGAPTGAHVSVGSSAFAFSTITHMTNIYVVNSSLNQGAFMYCKFDVINLDNTVKDIGEYAFCSCNNLTTVNGIENVESIKRNAFSFCQSLSGNIVFNSLKTVDNAAFAKAGYKRYSTQLDPTLSFSIPNTVTSIYGDSYNSAFNNAYINNLTIAAGASGLNCAFYGARIKSVTLSEGYNADGAVLWGSYIADSLYIPSTLKTIPSSFCQYLKPYIFGPPDHFANITISEGVEDIQNHAFYLMGDPYVIPLLTLPSTITYIRDGAFSYAYIDTVVIKAITPPNLTLGTGDAQNFRQVSKIYVPYGCGTSYKNTSNWSSLYNKIYELDENGNISS